MIEPLFENKFLNRALSVFAPNRTRPRLRWYEFKEGFSGELVEEAIASVGSNRERLRILDPFAGSGTTLVTGAKFGHAVTGIEVNPFLAFTANAKCHAGSWSNQSYQGAVDKLCNEGPFEIPSPLEGLSTFTERDEASKWLFNRSVLRGFAAIDAKITHRYRVYGPMRLALLAAAMDCCNARPDGKCLRYFRDWRSNGYCSEDLRKRFAERLVLIHEDLNVLPLKRKLTRVLSGDARRVLRKLKEESFDLLVTSPPYLNSFDYSDVYRPELFLGGFVRSNRELREVRLKTIRSHVQVGWNKPREIVSDMLEPILKRLKKLDTLWSRRLPEMVQAYFEDMHQILQEARRVVRHKGQAWIVVSTSAYGGVEIPVDLVIADIASRQGWKLLGVNVLRSLRAAGQHWEHLEPGSKPPLRESLIIIER